MYGTTVLSGLGAAAAAAGSISAGGATTAAGVGAAAATAAAATSTVGAAALGTGTAITVGVGAGTTASGLVFGGAAPILATTAAAVPAAVAIPSAAVGAGTLAVALPAAAAPITATGALSAASAVASAAGQVYGEVQKGNEAKLAARDESRQFEQRESMRQRGLRGTLNSQIASAAARGVVPGPGSVSALAEDSMREARIESGLDAERTAMSRRGLLLRARRAPAYGAAAAGAGILGKTAQYYRVAG